MILVAVTSVLLKEGYLLNLDWDILNINKQDTASDQDLHSLLKLQKVKD